LAKRVLVIDGRRFKSLHGFCREISREVIPGAAWGRSLDAFNDILSGGFGTPEEGFVLRWKHSAISRDRLGYSATVRLWRWRWYALLLNLRFEQARHVAEKLARAKRCEGPTLFDTLAEIIRKHGPGGDEAEDGVELILD